MFNLILYFCIFSFGFLLGFGLMACFKVSGRDYLEGTDD